MQDFYNRVDKIWNYSGSDKSDYCVGVQAEDAYPTGASGTCSQICGFRVAHLLLFLCIYMVISCSLLCDFSKSNLCPWNTCLWFPQESCFPWFFLLQHFLELFTKFSWNPDPNITYIVVPATKTVKNRNAGFLFIHIIFVQSRRTLKKKIVGIINYKNWCFATS